MFTDFSIIDEGKVRFLMSLPQMKNLGVSLDLRGTPEKILFHTGFLKGQGVPLHRNRAGHLTLDVNEICKKAKLSADKGRQLHAASSFPAVADEPSEIPSHDPPQPIAAEPAIPPPAVEKKYRLPAGQKVPPAQLHQRADQRAAVRNKPEVKEPEEHEEDEEDLPMDSFHPLQPTDPPVLPLSEHQPAAAADLEASRSRSRTHSEVSEAPTIQYPDPAPDPPRQSGQEEASLPEPSLPPPDPPSRSY